QPGGDLRRVRLAQPALGGHAYAVGQLSAERLAHHPLRLAVTVPGGDVDEVDAGVHRLPDGRRGLLPGGGPPDLTQPAATQREYADLAGRAQRPSLHRRALPLLVPTSLLDRPVCLNRLA